MEPPTSDGSDDDWADQDKMVFELAADLGIAGRQMASDDSQASRRTWCRALFAYIEGSLLAAKHLRIVSEYALLDEDVEDLLLERRRIDAPDGSARYARRFLPLPAAVKVTLEALTAQSSSGQQVAPDESKWARLADCVAIRNRVVHPKGYADLRISDKDVRLLREVGEWYIDTLGHAQELHIKAELHRMHAWYKRALRYFRGRQLPPSPDEA